MKRPFSLTIIAWISILAGTSCFLFLVLLSLYTDSGSSHNWFARFHGASWFIGGTVAVLAGGVLVLKGSRWGRWLILASSVLLVMDFFEMRAAVIIGYGLLLTACCCFLFHPQANAYFRERE